MTLTPFFGNAIGFIKVVVAKPDAAAALELVSEFETQESAEAICPQCGSGGFLPAKSQSGSNKVVAMLTWLFSNYAIAPDTIYECEACGFCAATPPAELSQK